LLTLYKRPKTSLTKNILLDSKNIILIQFSIDSDNNFIIKDLLRFKITILNISHIKFLSLIILIGLNKNYRLYLNQTVTSSKIRKFRLIKREHNLKSAYHLTLTGGILIKFRMLRSKDIVIADGYLQLQGCIKQYIQSI
jgi:hypothetical protein